MHNSFGEVPSPSRANTNDMFWRTLTHAGARWRTLARSLLSLSVLLIKNSTNSVSTKSTEQI